MIATSGVKSSMPIRGMMRRRGDSIGSVTWSSAWSTGLRGSLDEPGQNGPREYGDYQYVAENFDESDE